MLPPAHRGVPLLVVLLVLAPLMPADAQTPSAPCGVGTSQSGQQCTPNLALSNLLHYPEKPDVRSPVVEMCADITNTGGTPSTPGVEVDFDLSTSDSWHLTLPHQLVTGQTQTLCVNQSAMGEGDYYFLVHVDPQRQFPETTRDDNDKLCANHDPALRYPNCFRVLGMPQVNLVMTQFVVSPRIAGPDSVQTFLAVIENQGRENATATNLTFADDNGVIATLPVKALAIGESTKVLTSTNANTRPAGNFTATAIVDPDESIHELTHEDNARNYTYGILPHPLPDLAFVNVPHLTGNYSSRRGLHFSGGIINQGARGALKSTLRVFDGDKPIRNFTIPQLVRGANATFSDTLVFDGGIHNLRYVIDADRAIAESDEANNEIDQAISIAGDPAVDTPQANLVVERVSALPDDPGPNDLVTINLLVHNVGTATSNATSVTLDVDGVTLKVSKVTTLAPGHSQPYSIPWPGASVGTHAVNLFVDPNELVNESDKNDNALSALLVITDPAPPAPTPTPTPTPVPNGTTSGNGTTTPPPPPVTNTTPPKAAADALSIARVDVATRAIPGGLKGDLIATLRNNAIDRMGRVTVSFLLDGAPVKEVLVDGIAGAGSAAVPTGEIDLPPGNHTITVEAHLAGSLASPERSTQTYEADAGARSVPGPGAFLVVGAVALAAVFTARRARQR